MVARWILPAVILACGSNPSETTDEAHPSSTGASTTNRNLPSHGDDDPESGSGPTPSDAPAPLSALPQPQPGVMTQRETHFGAPVMGDTSTHRAVEVDPDQSRSEVQEIQQAMSLFEQGKISEAQSLLMAQVVRLPEDPDAHYWLGRCYEAEADHALAVESMLRATELDPEFASAWWSIGFNYTFQRRCADALPAQERYVQLRPNDPGGYYNRASCRWYTGDREGSLADAQKACEMGHTMACSHAKKQSRREELLDAFEKQRAAAQGEIDKESKRESPQ